MKFISYYTEHTPYEAVMDTHLLPSLKKWNLEYDIKAIKSLGNWGANTSYKATFILEMLKKHKEDIIFLDADAIIEQRPMLFDKIPKKFDVAVHYLDWHLHWRNTKGQEKRELLSGTMMLRYNAKILNLVENYIKYCKKNPNMWEQKILQNLLEAPNNINIYKLPASYCAVINHKNQIPEYIGIPIITHYQASRKYKRK